MASKSIKLSIIFLIIFSGIACEKNDVGIEKEVRTIVGDYYISPTGDDENPGTIDLPWRTIQKAANTLAPGQVAVIKEGDYDEFVTIGHSGASEDSRIIIFSETLYGAKCKGFKIDGNFITLDGFDIEAFAPYYAGILISGNSNIDIMNCFIHECPNGGIRASSGSNYIKITNNLFEHNGQYGFTLSGSHGLIEGNSIIKTVQYHPKGLEPGFTGPDADGMRIFGDNHIVRANEVIDIGDITDKGNVDPHSDCIQTWDGSSDGNPIMTNTIIEGNFFSVSNPRGKGIMFEADKGNPAHHITIQNNIIEFRDVGIALTLGDFHDIFIYNNVFKAKLNDNVWGAAFALTNVTNYQIFNNITADCHPQHRKISGGSGTINYNLAWNSDNSRISLDPELQSNEISGVNPLFVNYSANYGVNDYHLQAGSPAINAGTSIESLSIDKDGTSRPNGSAYDMGPYEYKGGK